MSDKSALERVAASIALVSIAVAVTGTKACQENYEVGAQASITRSPDTTTTTTPAATVTGTITTTVTPATTGSITPTIAEPTPTNDVVAGDVGDDSSVGGGVNDDGLLQELSVLGEKGEDDSLPGSGSSAGAAPKADGNWLGKGFDGSQWEDSDGDGFSNSREERAGSDSNDANIVPTDVDKGQLDARLRQLDQDMDGLLNEDEAKRGTNPNLSDSDGDGKPDGAEVLSGGNPTDPSAVYVDGDGDGLGNLFEESKGINPNSNDTDGDGLRDDLELVVGSNPSKIDSDGDGISDGREYDLNTDPLLGEPDRAG